MINNNIKLPLKLKFGTTVSFTALDTMFSKPSLKAPFKAKVKLNGYENTREIAFIDWVDGNLGTDVTLNIWNLKPNDMIQGNQYTVMVYQLGIYNGEYQLTINDYGGELKSFKDENGDDLGIYRTPKDELPDFIKASEIEQVEEERYEEDTKVLGVYDNSHETQLAPIEANNSIVPHRENLNSIDNYVLNANDMQTIFKTFQLNRDYNIINGNKSLTKSGVDKIAMLLGIKVIKVEENINEEKGTVLIKTTAKKGERQVIGVGFHSIQEAFNEITKNRLKKSQEPPSEIDRLDIKMSNIIGTAVTRSRKRAIIEITGFTMDDVL